MRAGTGREIDLVNLVFRNLEREGFGFDCLGLLPKWTAAGDAVTLIVTVPDGRRYCLTLTLMPETIH